MPQSSGFLSELLSDVPPLEVVHASASFFAFPSASENRLIIRKEEGEWDDWKIVRHHGSILIGISPSDAPVALTRKLRRPDSVQWY